MVLSRIQIMVQAWNQRESYTSGYSLHGLSLKPEF